jgi:hypothetical protein
VVSDWSQGALLLWALASLVAVLFYTFRARKRELKVRVIPGLAAVDDAVGRAAEMGKPILFTTGWGGDIQRPTTIAALNMLRFVAARSAAYGCRLIFPTHDPVIAEAAREIIRNAYLDEGKAEDFRSEDINFVSPSQFGYAAAVDGIVSRAEPAAVFLLGTFEGEALILAETGNIAGAVQIAGTDSTIQLSFFIVACDYTLIGEELYSASAYLTEDNRVKASMHAQDLLRLVFLILLLLTPLLALFGVDIYREIF